MIEAPKTEVSTTEFSPHIEELHEFFRSRNVPFGKPDNLAPFVERLSKDDSFRDEMASMVRAIIYRERDGLMPAELMDLLISAVTGSSGEEMPEQARNAVRQMMGFAAGVFRSRWNPGNPVAAKDEADVRTNDVNEADPIAPTKVAANTTAAETSSRPTTPMFYQAQVVANGSTEPSVRDEPIADMRMPALTSAKHQQEEVVLPLRRTSEAADEPFLSLGGYAAQREPVATFLRGGDKDDALPFVIERQRSRGWVRLAVVLAVIMSFGLGMFARQWMLMRYGPAWPWHVPDALTFLHGSGSSVNTSPSAVQPSGAGATGVNGDTTAQRRKRAQVEAARSEWKGGRESASDLEPKASASSAGDPGKQLADAAGSTQEKRAKPAGSGDGWSTLPSNASTAKSGSEDNEDNETGRVTAMVGASPGLMDGRLLFAPKPEYPEVARLAHVQGPVVVETLVDRDGSVARARAISGNQLLRGAAEEAVMGRRYRPYVENDIPMAVRTLVTIDFRLP